MELDVGRCKVLNDWIVDIGLPPDIDSVWAEAHEGDPGYYLLMSAPDQPDITVDGEKVAGGVSAYMADTPRSRNGLAIDVMATLGTRALHEAFEWVKVDGVPLANAHPLAGEYMWEWLSSRCREMVEDYIETFPGHTDWWVQVTKWNGEVVYDGPSPCPPDLCELSIEDLAAGRLYSFDVTPIHFEGSHPTVG